MSMAVLRNFYGKLFDILDIEPKNVFSPHIIWTVVFICGE